MDTQRLVWAIRTALVTLSQAGIDPDELQDLAEFLADEVEQSNVSLPSIASNAEGTNTVTQRTLEEIEEMPITSIIGPHLVDMLDISPTMIPLIVDEILENYISGKPLQNSDDPILDNGLKQCELCERAAALTDHHLIPRSEHELFVKRGVFTLEECRSSDTHHCHHSLAIFAVRHGSRIFPSHL
ncbi:hypothetical protein P389DRAFT_165374 [Cystobasidium minutum MCA 4210]|uniref:uncharacterized protein n=1 Tax=Cystobasidium minutum MCA 4210 TaxID=1397322 RepID=UPI0034CD181C|eukprot:jgi/Rhomi1/165374/fgenesh1_kg.1_\